MATQYDDQVGIIIIGDSSVGKTCLLKRFTSNIFFEQAMTTLGIELFKKVVEIKKKKYLVKIWDSCGQERLHAITYNYYKNADGIIVVYDINNKNTFDTLDNWVESINEICEEEVPYIIIGNKTDLERMVSKEDIDNFQNQHKDRKMFECSCKTGEGTTEPFMNLIEQIINCKKKRQEGFNLSSSQNKTGNNTEKKCC